MKNIIRQFLNVLFRPAFCKPIIDPVYLNQLNKQSCVGVEFKTLSGNKVEILMNPVGAMRWKKELQGGRNPTAKLFAQKNMENKLLAVRFPWNKQVIFLTIDELFLLLYDIGNNKIVRQCRAAAYIAA